MGCDLNSQEIKLRVLTRCQRTTWQLQIHSYHSPRQASRTCHQLFRGRTLFFSFFPLLCRATLERLKPQHIHAVTKPGRWNVPFHTARRKTVKCGDMKEIVSIMPAQYGKIPNLFSISAATLDLFFFFILPAIKLEKLPWRQVWKKRATKQSSPTHYQEPEFNSEEERWFKKKKKEPRHDSFYESLSRPSRARTGAGKNTECMLGDERSSSPHIMSSRLLSVRLLVCKVKRRQQKASAAPAWDSQHKKAAVSSGSQPLLTSGHSRSVSPLLNPQRGVGWNLRLHLILLMTKSF